MSNLKEEDIFLLLKNAEELNNVTKNQSQKIEKLILGLENFEKKYDEILKKQVSLDEKLVQISKIDEQTLKSIAENHRSKILEAFDNRTNEIAVKLYEAFVNQTSNLICVDSMSAFRQHANALLYINQRHEQQLQENLEKKSFEFEKNLQKHANNIIPKLQKINNIQKSKSFQFSLFICCVLPLFVWLWMYKVLPTHEELENLKKEHAVFIVQSQKIKQQMQKELDDMKKSNEYISKTDFYFDANSQILRAYVNTKNCTRERSGFGTPNLKHCEVIIK